ncbi:unnamed protein product [Cuscuta campestris]|uniref:Uncharacterized protein n=1 Tax=Cuscuta campestris TaxID=132261 RepID=A0A484MTM7_9ASTE|nr:unnamed protein product [Cuscuta campestris]
MERWPKEKTESRSTSDTVYNFSSSSSSGSRETPVPARYESQLVKNLMEEKNRKKMKKKKKEVFVEEGYVKRAEERGEEDEIGRTKSLTDDDLEELKGCLDLGFGFNYEEIPELCNTLPALELCYSMSQKYQHNPLTTSHSLPNWKISSPGDDPEEVKARLKYWAQATVCTVRLCCSSSSQKRDHHKC